MSTSQTAPIEPATDSSSWYESGAEPINADLETASLIVRLGMAANVIASQLQAVFDATHRDSGDAARERDLFSSLVLTAAATHEALEVIRPAFPKLRWLAERGPHTLEAFPEVSQLIGGSHAASRVIKRARNQLAFHWDRSIVQDAVQAFSAESRIVWFEEHPTHTPVHAFSVKVLATALLGDQEIVDDDVDIALDRIDRAMRAILSFVTACTLGYLKVCSADLKRRRVAETEPT